jgi:hypothetical protein
VLLDANGNEFCLVQPETPGSPRAQKPETDAGPGVESALLPTEQMFALLAHRLVADGLDTVRSAS